MVRQEDYRVGRVLVRKKRRVRRFLLCLQGDAPAGLTLRAWRKVKEVNADLANINIRSMLVSSTVFNLNSYSEEQSLHDFRLRKSDVGRVCAAMSWTAGRTKRSRYVCDPLTACYIVLRRVSSSCTWYDLDPTFGMRYSALSEVFWEVVQRFVSCKGHLITSIRKALLQSRVEMYANAITNDGAPLDSCVGFIDCTKIRMTRPGGSSSNQRSCYSGHKRFHCLVYQTITTPDGLVFSLYGPEVGRRHDLTLLRNSAIQERLETCLLLNGRQFYIYGDAAYVLRPWLQTAFDRVGASLEQSAYNTAMSAVRVSVEWNYKDLKQMWTRNDFARLLQVYRFPVSLLYVSAALLLNFKTCLERSGGQVGSYFQCPSPTFDEYVNH